MNCILGSDGTQVTRAIVGTTSNVWSNHRVEVFWENQFFVFWGGPKKLFWGQKTSFGLRNPPFGGVILLKLFDLGHHFGDIQLILPLVFLDTKKFFGAPQNTKNWFSQKTRPLWFDQTLEVVPTMALVIWVPSYPCI